MSKIDFDWVRSQFDKAKITLGTGQAVLGLLAKWEELQVDEDHVDDVIEVFGKVAKGHALLEDADETWVDVIPGQLPKGTVVRVKPDAFSGEAGQYHNGRVGKVVGVRYGDVIFRSTDGGNPIDGAHYAPQALQRRIK